MSKKFSLKEIKSKFNEKGLLIIVGEKYINAHTTMKCICIKSGHKLSKSWHSLQQDKGCRKCYEEGNTAENNPNWRGGVKKLNLPLYSTYNNQIKKYYKTVKIIKNDIELLGVSCTYCGNYFVPNTSTLLNCIQTIKGTKGYFGENNLYCSENCKKACPTYGQVFYPKGFKKTTSREVQPQLRKLVLKRDDYRCQICEATLEETQLHCHHITGVEQNPIESADIDNCITLCKKHHKQVHKLPGCGYYELRCVD